MRPEGRLRGLYLVTPDTADTAHLLALVASALRGAPALLQYRSKLADAVLKRQQAEGIAACCRAASVPFIVNDSVALAQAVGADGVHLGRDDGDVAAARAVLGADAIIGVTCYNEWPRAEAGVAAGADYVAFGAAFASPTKPAAVRAPLDLYARARRDLAVPVAAIGGITLDNAPQLLDAGAELLAVISDVFDAANPAARAGAYRALFDVA